jgi:hypothetical protein
MLVSVVEASTAVLPEAMPNMRHISQLAPDQWLAHEEVQSADPTAPELDFDWLEQPVTRRASSRVCVSPSSQLDDSGRFRHGRARAWRLGD